MKTLGKVAVVIGGLVALTTFTEAYLGGMFGGFDRVEVVIGFITASLLLGGGGCAYRFSGRQTSRRMYKGGRFTLLVAAVGLAASGCATTVVPVMQRQVVRIPDEVLRFVGDSHRGVYNQNMPPEIRYVVDHWVHGAGGEVVYDYYRAPLKFEWAYSDLPIGPYGNGGTVGQIAVGCAAASCSPSAVGQFFLGRLGNALEAVQNAIPVNGWPLGPQPSYYYPRYAQRVTIWYFLSGVEKAGEMPKLRLNGRGSFDYWPNDPRCDRPCAYEQEALRALMEDRR